MRSRKATLRSSGDCAKHSNSSSVEGVATLAALQARKSSWIGSGRRLGAVLGHEPADRHDDYQAGRAYVQAEAFLLVAQREEACVEPLHRSGAALLALGVFDTRRRVDPALAGSDERRCCREGRYTLRCHHHQGAEGR